METVVAAVLSRRDSSPDARPTHKGSCTECQRRKQKCDRKWPCSGCRKRSVEEQCLFPQDHQPSTGWKPTENVKRKRENRSESDSGVAVSGDSSSDDMEALGYGPNHPLALLGEKVADMTIKDLAKVPQHMLHPADSPQLKRALDAMPSQVFMDSLIQHFLASVNFYYYIIYPKSFHKEYKIWCRERMAEGLIGVQWTCLVIMICACAIQHADDKLAKEVEEGLGKDIKTLSKEYHDIARELHGVIPVDQSHIFSIQYLLHSCYWFKAEAKFADCWHVLGAAVLEGQKLSLHQDSTVSQMSDFDREMCRRLWCILDAWDWLVSALLARPMLIDRAQCTAKQPALTLEKYPISPLLHIRFQSELIAKIFKRFGPPSNLTDPKDIEDYEAILREWMKTFPDAFALEQPDVRHEIQYPWVQLHRHYLHTTALSLALGPLKPFLMKPMSSASPQNELAFREDGIKFALSLMNAVHGFYDYVWTRDTTFHFVPFCISDTAMHLISAWSNDTDESRPLKDESHAAIQRAIATLKKLAGATETAKMPLNTLQNLYKKVGAKKNVSMEGGNKRQKVISVQDLGPAVLSEKTEVKLEEPTHSFSDAYRDYAPGMGASYSTGVDAGAGIYLKPHEPDSLDCGSSVYSAGTTGTTFTTPSAAADVLNHVTSTDQLGNLMSSAVASHPHHHHHLQSLCSPMPHTQSMPVEGHHMHPVQYNPTDPYDTTFVDISGAGNGHHPVHQPHNGDGFGYDPVPDLSLGSMSEMWGWQPLPDQY